ncbi:MAG TPA: flagellar basal-body rod protein FlgF [Armatimonadota bacterium]|jgi:flagellar basal-body rod protein FlgG
MIRGITSAAQGMMAQMAAQDVTANNLANVNTSGFKRDVPAFSVFLTGADGAAPITQLDTQAGCDFAQGSLKQTDDKLNFALEGDGFFSVQTAAGVAYTRDGSFTLSADGALVTGSGDAVLGANGPIKLAPGSFSVDERGVITQNGKAVDTLKVVSFADPQGLRKLGGNLITAPFTQATNAATTTKVRQGYLESSNVNSVSEMVSMISGYRAYEASQKAATAQDETLEKLVNEVGRV